jgi:Flp pilus assembly protein TadG
MRAKISLIADLNSLQGRKKFPVRMSRELSRKALMWLYLQNLINDSSGFTAIEYALIAALMAVAVIAAIA